MLVYFVRTLLPIGNGIPFYGALAALWCMQQYNDTTKTNAVQRSVGTLIGAGYGLLFLSMFIGIFCYKGLGYMGVVVMEPIAYIMVMFFSRVIFKEKITPNKIIGMCFIIGGIAVFYLLG